VPKKATPRATRLRTYAAASQVAAQVFRELRISVSLNDDGEWTSITGFPSVVRFEVVHGSELARWAYNADSMERVQRTGRAVLGEHLGFSDLFVPVRTPSGKYAVLVAGPFARARPTAGDVLERWRTLSGAVGRAGDAEFLRYLSMTLGTLALEGNRTQLFQRVLARFGTLLEERGDPEALVREIRELGNELVPARRFEHMGALVHEFIDEHSELVISEPAITPLAAMGVRHMLRHALVGFAVGAQDEADPVDAVIRREVFQRACADFCFSRGGAVSGPIGDQGVVILTDDPEGARGKVALGELFQRLRTLARRFGFRLHLGSCSAGGGGGMAARYQLALAAAERAVAQNLSVVEAGSTLAVVQSPLADLLLNVTRAVTEESKLLVPSFTRYLDAAAAHSGYRIEPLRAHLEDALDTFSGALRRTGVMDERSLGELYADVKRRTGKAGTVSAILAAYRAAVVNIEHALASPPAARRDRSLSRAIQYIHDHFAEPLTLRAVARIAGYAPTYFSTSFARAEGISFAKYLRRLRIERAKYMLTASVLSVERIAQISGFRSRNRFHLAFRAVTRTSPLAYRKKNRMKSAEFLRTA
jgi:AraC-like DNA-binding protein